MRQSPAKRLAIIGTILLFGGAILEGADRGSGTGVFVMVSTFGVSALFASGGLWAWARRTWTLPKRGGVASLALLFAVSGIGSGIELLNGPVASPDSALKLHPTQTTTSPPPRSQLSIISPSEGQTVSSAHVTVTGVAPPGALIVQDISLAPDESAVADSNGRWSMAVTLSSGSDALIFRIGSDRSTAHTLHLVLQGPTQSAPTSVETPTFAPSASPEPSSEPKPTATPVPTPEPTPVPTPAPVVVTVDDTVFVDTSKTKLNGAIGAYIWSDVSFYEQLGSISWVAKAPVKSSCRVVWQLTSDSSPDVTFSAKLAAERTASGTKTFQPDYGEYQLAVTSTCPSWSSTLAAKAPPPYWNPWRYNFTPGSVIYNPPSDFCSYFDCIASFWNNTRGYVMQCRDLMFSHSGGRSGSCSWHGGNKRALYRH